MGVQGVPKKVAIGPPKPQFFNETFKIFVVGRLFHSGFSAFSDLKIFNFTGPKSKFEIFKNSQKTRDYFLFFFKPIFLVDTNAQISQIICFLTKI